MIKKIIVSSCIISLLSSYSAPQNSVQHMENQPKTTTLAFTEPPEWAKTAIWYQIFVERFYNGDTQNNPTLETVKGSWPHDKPADWKVSDWTSDWYSQADWEKHMNSDFYITVQARRYGGDLEGVLKKLDYIKSLGVNAIYFNPLNDAPSLHKYDARNYHHVDVNFGSDPEGDMAIIATEDPQDPKTWKWTSADKMFLKVIEEAHKRGIKVVLDYSWNHTGAEFWAWKDVLKNQENSPYKDWYMIDSFKTDHSEFKYHGWAGVPELPELKKTDVVNRVDGHPYEGNMPDPIKQHIFDVSDRWLKPNGDLSKGIDGYRLDVADQIPMGFWREYRKHIRSVQPEALLVGEIWWEKWPDHLMDPRPYLGEIFDIVMHYQQYVPAREFFAKPDGYGGAEQFKQKMDDVQAGIAPNVLQSMMSMTSSHDAPRLLTDFYNKYKYKFQAKPQDNAELFTGKPDAVTYERVKLFLAQQYTFIGAPQIYAGDEMGMWGSDDPDNRKPLWWSEMKFQPESNNPIGFQHKPEHYEVGFNHDLNNFYKMMIQIRNENPVLSTGDLTYIKTEGDILAYKRADEKSAIVVIFNNSDEPKTWDGETFSGTDLITKTTKTINSQTELSPRTFCILKVK